MRVSFNHYITFMKGSYFQIDLDPTMTIGEICEKWQSYFNTNNLRVWKFKAGNWTTPHDWNNQFFDKKTTLQEYVDFYPAMKDKVYLIFI